mmetsp:Transcript_168382/g.409269  ORF Transcript_168382/g.409269 Transcript_168382/m.409269 type:complete len:151 (+) Transcript_168382:138-590(+)
MPSCCHTLQICASGLTRSASCSQVTTLSAPAQDKLSAADVASTDEEVEPAVYAPADEEVVLSASAPADDEVVPAAFASADEEVVPAASAPSDAEVSPAGSAAADESELSVVESSLSSLMSKNSSLDAPHIGHLKLSVKNAASRPRAGKSV